MKMVTLTIPRHRDPLARAALLGLVAVVAWLNIAQPNTPSLSAQAPIIVLATPALHEQLAVPPASLRELAPSAAQWTRQTPEAQRGVALAAPMIAPLHLVEHQPTAPPPCRCVPARQHSDGESRRACPACSSTGAVPCQNARSACKSTADVRMDR
jgi:hypothetical protein